MARHRFAFGLTLLTIALTFCLITLGGVVHNTGSSLACPDWPKCFGQWMPEMTGGVFYEHSHRMLGTLVGMCAIGLCIALWRRAEGYPPLRGHALALLTIIIFQGVLGGITVIYELPTIISTAHLATSMLVMLYMVYLAHEAFRRGWREDPAAAATLYPAAAAAPHLRWLVIVLVALYAQIVLGAFIRHAGAWIAAGQGPGAALLGRDPNTGNLTLWPSDHWALLNVFHRYIAVVLAVAVVALCARLNMKLGPLSSPHRMVLFWLPPALVLLQVLVGVGMVAMYFQVVMRTAHLAVAALLLGVLFHVWLLVGRSARAAHVVSGRSADSPVGGRRQPAAAKAGPVHS